MAISCGEERGESVLEEGLVVGAVLEFVGGCLGVEVTIGAAALDGVEAVGLLEVGCGVLCFFAIADGYREGFLDRRQGEST